jgi:hypothetical protein
MKLDVAIERKGELKSVTFVIPGRAENKSHSLLFPSLEGRGLRGG